MVISWQSIEMCGFIDPSVVSSCHGRCVCVPNNFSWLFFFHFISRNAIDLFSLMWCMCVARALQMCVGFVDLFRSDKLLLIIVNKMRVMFLSLCVYLLWHFRLIFVVVCAEVITGHSIQNSWERDRYFDANGTWLFEKPQHWMAITVAAWNVCHLLMTGSVSPFKARNLIWFAGVHQSM